jgi:hypothetical protein
MSFVALIDFGILNYPCFLAINPTWIWHKILFKYAVELFASILLEIFTSMFIRNIGLYSFIVVVPLSGFFNHGNTGLRGELESVLCFSVFW